MLPGESWSDMIAGKVLAAVDRREDTLTQGVTPTV
jgi:hypothetical protein